MKRLLTFLMLGLFMISFASAGWNWDNVLTETTENPNTGYPSLEIINAIGFGETLFEGTLSEHTPICGEDCFSKLEINHTGGVLIDDFRSLTLRDGEWVLQPLRSYSFTYEAELPQYENECEPTGDYEINGTEIIDCTTTQVGTYTGTKTYRVGEELPAGNYELALNAKKKPSRTVDWQIQVQGKWLEQWAVWGNISEGDTAEVILNSPANGEVALSSSVTFNASANVTGGAISNNMTLYNNISGSWIANGTVYTVDVSNLTTYYKFDNTTGVVYDIMNNNNGSESGVTRGVTGKINTAFNFSSGDYVRTNNAGMITNTPFSYSLWINSQDMTPATPMRFLGSRDTSGLNEDVLQILTNGSLQYTSYWNGSTQAQVVSGALSDNTWHFVTLTYDLNNVNLYVDNSLVSTDTSAVLRDVTPNRDLAIGVWAYDYGTDYYFGLIDEVGIWNKSISTNEISSLYNNGNGLSPSEQSAGYLTQTFIRTISGPTLWNVEACDSDGDCGFATSNYTVLLDTTAPTISVESPTGTLGYGLVGSAETLNVTFTDANIDKCWYNYNGTNTTIEGCVTATKNSTTFPLQASNTNMTIYANDTLGNLNLTFISWDYNLTVNSQTAPATSVESASEAYTANLSYNSSKFSIISGSLTFNGTAYAGTRTGAGDSAIFTTSATMPSITETTNFTGYWTISLTDVSGTIDYNLTSTNVTVSTINLSLCDDSNNIAFWNFTILNESNSAEINSTFEGTFVVSPAGSTATNSFSYSDTNGNLTQYDFCITPSGENYTIDASLKLTKSGYVDKFYNYESISVTNATREDNLYMLATGDSTSFIIHTVYNDGVDVTEAEVKVQRYYPGSGLWVTTEILTTNYEGEAIGHILSEDADYRFNVSLSGVSVYNSSATKIVCATAPCTVTLNIPISSAVELDVLSNIVSSLTYSSTTNVFTYTYTDTSGSFTNARLNVIRSSPANAIIITPCNETKTTAAGVITCDITGQVNGTYRATGYITRGSDESVVKRIYGVLGTAIYNSLGNDGVLWSIFLFMAIIMLGIARPTLSIIFGIAGVVTLRVLELINIGLLSVFSLITIAIILLIRMGRE